MEIGITVALIAAAVSLFAALVAHRLAVWREQWSRRAMACAAFRATLLESFHGLDPEPVDWPAPPKPARPAVKLIAPGQDCVGVVVGSEETGTRMVPGKQAAYEPPDPNDFAAPVATVPRGQGTFNCHSGGFVIAGPKPTTTVPGDAAAGDAGATPPTAKAPPTTKKP